MLKILLYRNAVSTVSNCKSLPTRSFAWSLVAWLKLSLSRMTGSVTTTSENKPLLASSSSSNELKLLRMAFDFSHHLVAPIVLSFFILEVQIFDCTVFSHAFIRLWDSRKKTAALFNNPNRLIDDTFCQMTSLRTKFNVWA